MSFDVIVKAIGSGFYQFSFRDAIDILLIATVIYYIIILTKGTRAYQVIKGLALLFIAAAVSQLLGLVTSSWILESVLRSGALVTVILFQPEFRRGLEYIGRGKVIKKFGAYKKDFEDVVSEIHRAVFSMAKRRVGALIVIEQRTRLGEIIATGTRIDGVVSAALLENIFEPNTPLHDGATIIREDVIIAAGCFLPLSDDIMLARELGTRHRAALGVSVISDSVTIIVSEETGIVSIAKDGKLVRYIDSKALRDELESIFLKPKDNSFSLVKLFKRRDKNEA